MEGPPDWNAGPAHEGGGGFGPQDSIGMPPPPGSGQPGTDFRF
jgi:hypothetical protein